MRFKENPNQERFISVQGEVFSNQHREFGGGETNTPMAHSFLSPRTDLPKKLSNLVDRTINKIVEHLVHKAVHK